MKKILVKRVFMNNQYSLIVFDFDGVLTDNRVYVSEEGKEMVACNRSDGWWMGKIKEKGLEQIILSTEVNPVVSARGKKLGIEVHQGKKDKGLALKEIAQSKGMSFEKIIYIGNDMNDWDCFNLVGWSFAPQDSHPKILEIAKTVLPVAGGAGVARFIYEFLFP